MPGVDDHADLVGMSRTPASWRAVQVCQRARRRRRSCPNDPRAPACGATERQPNQGARASPFVRSASPAKKTPHKGPEGGPHRPPRAARNATCADSARSAPVIRRGGWRLPLRPPRERHSPRRTASAARGARGVPIWSSSTTMPLRSSGSTDARPPGVGCLSPNSKHLEHPHSQRWRGAFV